MFVGKRALRIYRMTWVKHLLLLSTFLFRLSQPSWIAPAHDCVGSVSWHLDILENDVVTLSRCCSVVVRGMCVVFLVKSIQQPQWIYRWNKHNYERYNRDRLFGQKLFINCANTFETSVKIIRGALLKKNVFAYNHYIVLIVKRKCSLSWTVHVGIYVVYAYDKHTRPRISTQLRKTMQISSKFHNVQDNFFW